MLDLKSQLLFVTNETQTLFFMNGEATVMIEEDCDLLKAFADNRFISPQANMNAATLKLLHAWYLAGFVNVD